MCGTCGAHAAGTAAPGRRTARGWWSSARAASVSRQSPRCWPAGSPAAGARVLAIDADEQCNLGADDRLRSGSPRRRWFPSAGPMTTSRRRPERDRAAGPVAMLRLNPDTGDIVDRLAIVGPDGVRLLVMGGVQRAGGGCLCPENALLAAAIAGMRARDDEVVVMDTHAGVEHFGRSLARGFDVAVVIVEPTFNSVQVGLATARLARRTGHRRDPSRRQLGTRAARDLDRVTTYVDQLGGFTFASVHTIPYDERVRDAEPSVEPLIEASAFGDAVGHLAEHLLGHGVAVRTGAGSCA